MRHQLLTFDKLEQANVLLYFLEKRLIIYQMNGNFCPFLYVFRWLMIINNKQVLYTTIELLLQTRKSLRWLFYSIVLFCVLSSRSTDFSCFNSFRWTSPLGSLHHCPPDPFLPPRSLVPDLAHHWCLFVQTPIFNLVNLQFQSFSGHLIHNSLRPCLCLCQWLGAVEEQPGLMAPQ